MRLADLLDLPVHDAAGRHLGAVRDVRLGPLTGGPVPVLGVVVGHRRAMARLGYAYGQVQGPWLVAVLARRLGRHLRYVPWADVTVEPGRLRVDLARSCHPAEVAA